jgi:hypothetical protein
MDEDGYPTDETIAKIEAWDPLDFEGLAEFLVSLWRFKNYARFENGLLHLSTGGWSGNEDLIAAIPAHWSFFYKQQWRSGGHFIFGRNRPDFNEGVCPFCRRMA